MTRTEQTSDQKPERSLIEQIGTRKATNHIGRHTQNFYCKVKTSKFFFQPSVCFKIMIYVKHLVDYMRN